MAVQNDNYLRALNRQPVERTPIWIMRQAGRYLPEYRETRARAGDFLTLCKTPELACEVTLQPLARFDLDAAILFSDILTIPDAMGLGLHFIEGEGPKFHHPIRSAEAVAQLPIPDPHAELNYVPKAIEVIQHELSGKVPLIGFAGSPWTLATYMVEGGSTREFSIIKRMLFSEPAILHELLDKLATSVTHYLNAQIEAGVNALMIFDSWGGILSTQDYQEFSLAYMQKIVSGLHREYNGTKIPVTLFTKNGSQWIEQIAATGCDAIGVDWTTSLTQVRSRVGDQVAVQGNLDPMALFASPERIREEAKRVLSEYGKGNGHIFNLGHGIHKNVPPEHVQVLVDAVHEFSQ